MGIRDAFSSSSCNISVPTMGEITAFVDNAAEGAIEGVRRFCRKYPDYIDFYDKYGQTALGAAAANFQTEIGDLLLLGGADPNKLSADGGSPFLALVTTVRTARDKKDLRFLDSMLIAGADLNARQAGTQMTALMFYAVYSNTAVFNLLIKNGADPTLHDSAGRTARDHAEAQLAAFERIDAGCDVKDEIASNIRRLELAEQNWDNRPPAGAALVEAVVERLRTMPN